MIPYVKIAHDEGLELKRTMLSGQMNLLGIAQRISSYRKLRKHEIAKRNILKREIHASIMALNSLLNSLPSPIPEGIKIKRAVHETPELKKSQDIASQLQEIKEKLRNLNS